MATTPIAAFDEATGKWLIKQASRIHPQDTNRKPGDNTINSSFWGLVWTEGPDGETDYTDERYFIRRVYQDGDVGETDTASQNLVVQFWNDRDDDPYIVTATNTNEVTFTSDGSNANDGTHTLAVYSLVYVSVGIDAGKNAFCWFSAGGGGGGCAPGDQFTIEQHITANVCDFAHYLMSHP